MAKRMQEQLKGFMVPLDVILMSEKDLEKVKLLFLQAMQGKERLFIFLEGSNYKKY
ncbi:MAG: hypothetical protein MZV64_00795 [Ignavibacteriales bacterium]|nr:hypothetical protein [Ignavibacteriales bacterium]